MTLPARTLLAAACLAAAPAAAQAPAVTDAWIRATPPGARTAAAYLTLTGTGTADRLVGAATPAAATIELHTHVMEGGMARMAHVPEIEVPARGTVRLEPGGLHLMLIDIAAPLAPDAKVPLRLEFASGAAVEIEAPVVDARRGAPSH
jgi:copper(I)-binding protein